MHREWRTTKTQAEAQKLVEQWRSAGLDHVSSSQSLGREVLVQGYWYEPLLGTPFGTTMPRDKRKYRDPRTGEPISDISIRLAQWFGIYRAGDPIPARARKRLERLRLFFGGHAAVPEAKGLAVLSATGEKPYGTIRRGRSWRIDSVHG